MMYIFGSFRYWGCLITDLVENVNHKAPLSPYLFIYLFSGTGI
jgi:hypothetical protein